MSNLGFILYGIFTFTCVTVLINTLIAMLEKTIMDIEETADIEWKFARSKLYMEYIRDGKNRIIYKIINFFCFFLGNTLPVPLNILPSPTSIINLVNRIKQMIISYRSSLNDEKKNLTKIKEQKSIRINMGYNENNHNIISDGFKNEKIFNRKRSFLPNETLTYKIVIERIVKRFLLYYKDSHIGLDEVKNNFEFREIKNDIGSFRFEVSYEIDGLDEMRTSLVESMNKFNENLKEYFDFEQIKHHLDHQKIS